MKNILSEKNKTAIILGLVCFAVTIGICIQIKSVNLITENEGININDNADLVEQVLRKRQELKDIRSARDEVNKKLESMTDQMAQDDESYGIMNEQIKHNNRLLGLTEVKGEGIIIKLDDNREVNLDEVIIDANQLLVHEGDLLQIVNELYNAGADAVSINDKRIVNTTSILCDGNILRINDEIVSVPVEIKAIGYPAHLYFALNRTQGYLDLMKSDGVIVSTERSDDITIPKYEGVYHYEYMKR